MTCSVATVAAVGAATGATPGAAVVPGNAALGVMQTHLAQHDWFAGGHYSIADIALYGYTHSAAEGGFDLAAYPAGVAWLGRVANQPGHVPLAEAW